MKRDLKACLLETKGGHFADRGSCQPRSELDSLLSQLDAGLLDSGLNVSDLLLDNRGLLLASIEPCKVVTCLACIGEDVLDRVAVLASEGLHEVQTLGERGEAFRVHIDRPSVRLDGLLEVSDGRGGRVVGLRDAGRAGVEADEFVDAAPDDGEAARHRVILLPEACDDGSGNLKDSRSITGPQVLVGEGSFVVGVESGGLDFVNLMGEELALAFDGCVVTKESLEIPSTAITVENEGGQALAQWEQAAEGVKDVELSCGLEEGLVFMGPVEVHEALAEGGQRGEGRG